MFGVMAFVFQVTAAFLEVAKHLPANGKQCMNPLRWFACAAFFFSPQLNCLYLNPHILALLPSRFSPPACCGGVCKWLCGG